MISKNFNRAFKWTDISGNEVSQTSSAEKPGSSGAGSEQELFETPAEESKNTSSLASSIPTEESKNKNKEPYINDANSEISSKDINPRKNEPKLSTSMIEIILKMSKSDTGEYRFVPYTEYEEMNGKIMKNIIPSRLSEVGKVGNAVSWKCRKFASKWY
jgi:hypothetical protein